MFERSRVCLKNPGADVQKQNLKTWHIQIDLEKLGENYETTNSGEKLKQRLAVPIFLGSFCFWNSLRQKLRLSASKKEHWTFLMALPAMMVVCNSSCTEKKWQSHRKSCCNNGSAVQTTDGEHVWVKARSVTCGSTQIEVEDKSASRGVLIVVMIGTIACVRRRTGKGRQKVSISVSD